MSKIYFEGRYSYRKTKVLWLGLLLSILCSGLFFFVLLTTWSQYSAPNAVPMKLGEGIFKLIHGLLTGVMAVCGLSMLRGYVLKRVDYVTISNDGITQLGKLMPWEDICYLGIHQYHGGHMRGRVKRDLSYRKTGKVSERIVFLDTPLTKEQYDLLLKQLTADIQPSNPQLSLGDKKSAPR